MLRISIDANNKSKMEQLKFENSKLKAENFELQKFKVVAAKAAHDIRSPLGAILMMLPQCNTLPEKLCNILKHSVKRINDIAEDILSQFAFDHNLAFRQSITNNQLILIALEILFLVESKKIEYTNQAVNFVTDISDAAYFACLNIDKVAFSRSLSNLINNAVTALQNKPGTITINLAITKKMVHISVADTGIGMPEIIVYKIKNGLRITRHKSGSSHYGLGLEQVRDMLKNNNGKMSIESKVGIGTNMKLSFSKLAIQPQRWLLQKLELHPSSKNTFSVPIDSISPDRHSKKLELHPANNNMSASSDKADKSMKLNSHTVSDNLLSPSRHRKEHELRLNDDGVIILENNASVRDILETKFKDASATIKRRYFKQISNAVEFMNCLTGRVTFLVNYELIQKDLSNLFEIAKNKHIDKIVLITEQYDDAELIDSITKTKIKILPKPLISKIPIVIYNDLSICPQVQIQLC